MKRTISTVFVTFAAALLLFGGNRAPISTPAPIQPVIVQAASKADFITRERAAVQALIISLNDLVALKRQYDALAYANVTTGLLDADFTGSNADITLTEFKAAVNAGAELNTAFTSGGTVSAGVDAKLYRLR